MREIFEKAKLNLTDKAGRAQSYARALREDLPSLKECAYMSTLAIPVGITIWGLATKNWVLTVVGGFTLATSPMIVLGLEDFFRNK